PMYNLDVIGTRHNRGETAINRSNAGQLEQKWRFPPQGSDLEIGVIHATPTVVDGYVYFGTATDPTFYNLTPHGHLPSSYRRQGKAAPSTQPKDERARNARFQATLEGIMTSALVTADTVYFADLGGWVYALDRTTGAERWKVSTRAAPFPDAHFLNVLFAS